MEDLLNELVINWDHAVINYVPVSNWTMAEEGLKLQDWVTRGSLLQYLEHHWQETFFHKYMLEKQHAFHLPNFEY